MPEGDTIYRAARALQQAIAGKVVTGFETGLAKLARVNDDTPLVGRVVDKVESRGKWLLIYFSGDLILATHMLMSGSWHLYHTGERWQMGRSRMRAVIRTEEWEAVAFNVPVMQFHTQRTLQRSPIAKLGKDILAPDFAIAEGVSMLRQYRAQNPEGEIGVALLDQHVLAGLGNVYKSEVAFAAGVNPFRAMRTITLKDMERMMEHAHRYMRANTAEGKGNGIVTYSGSRSTTHAMDRGERLWVYGRQGKKCRRCGATVMMRKQGLQARSSYWCPVCQPLISDEA